MAATDAAEPIVKKLFTTREELLAALGNNYFYVELLIVSIAILVAFLFAYAVRYRANIYIKEHPLKKIDDEFLTKPISLLGPVLAYLLLNMAQPLSEEYSKNSLITDAVIQLCLYFIAARTVLLVVLSRPVAWFIACVLMVTAVLDVTGFTAITSNYLAAKSIAFGKYSVTMLNLIHGIIILVVVLWCAGLLSRTLESYLRRASSLSYSARALTVKFFRMFVYFAALMIVLSVLGVDLTAFAVFGGAIGVGIGLGLQKITANFLSGITLLLEKSIMIGDLIEVAGVSGHVREMNIRYVLVETADGRDLMVPNEELTVGRVINWSHSNEQARIEIKIVLDFDTDAKVAIKHMLACAKAHPRCLRKPEPLCWLREFNELGMVFLLTFWIPDVHEGRNTPQSDVMLAILETFRAENIKFAQTLNQPLKAGNI